MAYNFCIRAGTRLPKLAGHAEQGMVKCRYADCDGELEPEALYCEECGRSQAPGQVATALAGAQVRLQAPPARLTADLSLVRPLAASSVSLPRPPAAPGAPSAGSIRDLTIPLPLALAFGLLLVLLLMG